MVHHSVLALNSAQHSGHGHSFVEGYVWRIFGNLNGANSCSSMHNMVYFDAVLV